MHTTYHVPLRRKSYHIPNHKEQTIQTTKFINPLSIVKEIFQNNLYKIINPKKPNATISTSTQPSLHSFSAHFKKLFNSSKLANSKSSKSPSFATSYCQPSPSDSMDIPLSVHNSKHRESFLTRVGQLHQAFMNIQKINIITKFISPDDIQPNNKCTGPFKNLPINRSILSQQNSRKVINLNKKHKFFGLSKYSVVRRLSAPTKLDTDSSKYNDIYLRYGMRIKS